MRKSVVFLCFECCEKYNDTPGIRFVEATGQILRAECEECKRSRYGKLFEIVSGIKRKRQAADVEPEPVP